MTRNLLLVCKAGGDGEMGTIRMRLLLAMSG
jgi:hypothetical protein